MREPVGFDQAVSFLRTATTPNTTATTEGTASAVAVDPSMTFLLDMLGPGSSGAATAGAALFDSGARSCVVRSDSSMLTSDLSSAEAHMRRTIIERDWLDGVIALPDHLFADGTTGATAWVLTQHKNRKRHGQVAVVDARPLGDLIAASDDAGRGSAVRAAVVMMTHLVVDATDLSADERVQLVANEKFGFLCLTVDSPQGPKWRMDVDALKRLTKSAGWQSFRLDREAIESVDGLIALVAERRHNIAITWTSEVDCFNDVHKSMGVHTSHEVTRLAVRAMAIATKGKIDPDKRIVVRVALPPGYLGLSALGRREANQRASKKYLAGRVDIMIDDALTIVGYAIESPGTPTSRGDGVNRTAA
jgi:hypothetical protein